MMDKRQPFLQNCVIHMRAGDKYLFSQTGSTIECFLDGYEIRPLPQDEFIHDDTVTGTVDAVGLPGGFSNFVVGGDRADAERFRWVLKTRPVLLASIAYSVAEACRFSDPRAAIDAAMRELP